MLEVSDGLFVGAKAGGSVGRGAEAVGGLRPHRIGLGALVGGAEGGEVVAGESAGGFIGFRRLEMAGGSEMTAPPLAHRERVVRDLADE